ncbi:MAG: S-methyl-5'-thioadenosine phosphorylase [Candidatus Lambdaproteobacteria bacterium]|nr:S-methyl-5'-thioadenosine phosphorylase [Candidatus Lambdaproteobacteria bacterium]
MKFGILGGSGLYHMHGIEGLREQRLSTPFGDPSDVLVSGVLHGREVVFLPRHGRDHRFTPSEIPYRANIWALKKLGVTHLVSVSAVGSLREEIAPGHIVFPDQFIDRTVQRESTFFGNGVVAHVQFGDPVCPELLEGVTVGARHAEAKAHRGGTYVCMEGPAFSTRAESNLYRAWGGAVIGMTNLQEAKLAREAELCFATIALATDYDCWHQSAEEVNVETILEVMRNNIEISRRILSETIRTYQPGNTCSCRSALKFAILTPPEQIPRQVKRDLAPLIGHYVGSV